MLWKLNTTIYGLSDALRSWDLNVKKELIELGAIVSKYDPVIFIWYNQSKVNELLCTLVDDFLFGETELFLNKVINPIKHVFTIESEHFAAFMYLGLNTSQCHSEIAMDQVNYIKSVDYIAISNDRKNRKDDLLCKEETDNLKTLVAQLVWIAGKTRPDLAFKVCQLRGILNHSKVDYILKANKLVLKAKNENILLRFGLPGPTENFKFVCYNDSLLGNLKDGGSQGGFINHLVGKNNISSLIMWKSKKLRRVVKSTMAAETLIQVEAAEACFWYANLLSEMLYYKPNNHKIIKIECYTDNH